MDPIVARASSGSRPPTVGARSARTRRSDRRSAEAAVAGRRDSRRLDIPLPPIASWDVAARVDDDEGKGARPTRVLVVDDEGDLRHLVRLAFERAGGFDVVGEARDGREAIHLAAIYRPDVITLDLGLPDLPGLEVLAELRVVSPESHIVVFSGLDAAAAETAALGGGAARYVVKSGGTAALLSAIGETRPDQWSVVSPFYPADARTARAARLFARTACDGWGCDDIAESALLVTSELVTNAITHARSRCKLTIRLGSDVLRIEVFDDCDRVPSQREVDHDAENGRGVFLVAALARSWGIDPVENGKVVWAELARTP